MRCVEPSMSVNTNVTVPDGNPVPIRATMSIASHVPFRPKAKVERDSDGRLGAPDVTQRMVADVPLWVEESEEFSEAVEWWL